MSLANNYLVGVLFFLPAELTPSFFQITFFLFFFSHVHTVKKTSEDVKCAEKPLDIDEKMFFFHVSGKTLVF